MRAYTDDVRLDRRDDETVTLAPPPHATFGRTYTTAPEPTPRSFDVAIIRRDPMVLSVRGPG